MQYIQIIYCINYYYLLVKLNRKDILEYLRILFWCYKEIRNVEYYNTIVIYLYDVILI